MFPGFFVCNYFPWVPIWIDTSVFDRWLNPSLRHLWVAPVFVVRVLRRLDRRTDPRWRQGRWKSKT